MRTMVVAVDGNLGKAMLNMSNPRRFVATILWRHFRRQAFALAGLSALGIGLMSLEPVFIRELINALSAPVVNARDVWVLFGWICGAWFLSSFANRVRDIVELKTSPELRKQTQLLLYRWLAQHASAYFKEHEAGTLSQKIKQSGNAVLVIMDTVLDNFVRLAVGILIAAAVLSGLPVEIFVGFLIWLIGFLVLSWRLAIQCLPLSKRFGEAASQSAGLLGDIFSNIDLVKSNARHDGEERGLQQALEVEKQCSHRVRWFLIRMALMLYSGLLIFQSVFIGLGIYGFLNAELNLGEVVMVISLAAILSTNVWGLSQQLQSFYDQLGILQSALAVVFTAHTVVDRSNAPALKVRAGKIEIKRINFFYRPERPVFQDFSLTIHAGEKLGLVGTSGAGKSTLIRLVRRHYDLQSGAIYIDEQDISRVTQSSLGRLIGEVPQDPLLLHRTLRENLLYSNPNASEKALWDAISSAHCESIVAMAPHGLDTVVGERGLKLSGGERQRIALARAFLKDAPILLLDEATNALDNLTESYVQDSIARLCQNKTVISIAHRLTTLLAMDRIVVLWEGQAIEEGTHQALLMAEGTYSQLWRSGEIFPKGF
jgi:ATP-binding cassette subfamily B protein